MPETSFILDAIKATYIKYADPSEMGSDAYDGLKEKETELKNFTHEFLIENYPGYEEAEESIAATIGDKLKELLTGNISVDDIIITPPTLSLSELYPYNELSPSSSSASTSIYSNEPYQIVAGISGGTEDLLSFNWELTITPIVHTGYAENELIFDEILGDVRYVSSKIIFHGAGTYLLTMTFTNIKYPSLQVFQTKSIYVVNR